MILTPVHRGGQPYTVAILDDDQCELADHRWTYAGGYAVRSLRNDERGNVSASMHRQVHGLRNGDPRAVHHVNENTLDNRRANLEVCASKSDANKRPHPKAAAAGHAAYIDYLERFYAKAVRS